MGKWVARTGMHLKPYCCVACGRTPMTGTEKGSEGPEEAYFCEGVDINWGDALFICNSCARVIGQLHGMLEPEVVNTLKQNLQDAEEELESTKSLLETTQKRVDRMLDGKAAVKEARAARPKKKEVANA